MKTRVVLDTLASDFANVKIRKTKKIVNTNAKTIVVTRYVNHRVNRLALVFFAVKKAYDKNPKAFVTSGYVRAQILADGVHVNAAEVCTALQILSGRSAYSVRNELTYKQTKEGVLTYRFNPKGTIKIKSDQLKQYTDGITKAKIKR